MHHGKSPISGRCNVAVSRVPADASISSNVDAGAAHDHLLVGWPRRYRALDLIRQP
jgi:hypothetical protein